MRDWTHYEITSVEDIERMLEHYRVVRPAIGAIDTETSGLHIIDDRPFLVQWGWLDLINNQGVTYVCDIEEYPALAQMAIWEWHKLAEELVWYAGANIKYDLHMLENWNPALMYRAKNLTDLQIWIRMGHDNIPIRFGGAPLSLKDYAATYVDRHAKSHEKLLKAEQSSIAKDLNQKLVQSLGMKKGALNEFFKDALNDPDDLPDTDMVRRYLQWREDLPPRLQLNVFGLVEPEHVPYNMLSRDVVKRYGHMDIVYTLESLADLIPVVTVRQNLKAVLMENSYILPFWEMERTGFDLDLDYLQQCKVRMKQYILDKRQYLLELTGEPLTCGQHARIKQILIGVGVQCTATGAEELDLLVNQLRDTNPDSPAIAFITTIQELRTLEKWYTTYLLRFTRQGKPKAYTQISQVGAASGRVTSDFQQFPKEAILDDQGNELFHPRRMVRVDAPDYPEIVYLDWSQIELRLQALYTILLGEPDINLCRAYMPYECDAESWVPTDVHSATTKIAFNMDETHPDFKHNRSMGKRVNFAKNYGASIVRIRAMFPTLSEAQIKAIDESYYKAFPGIRKYHEYCEAVARTEPYAVNMFGVKYYGVSGHNLKNMLVQGSAAYLLKEKIREIMEYLHSIGAKSKFQMNIHDENSFKRHKDDSMEIFYRIKEIMEDWSDCQVPIIAEMEVTQTTWAEKHSLS